jgi:hypothetical protein
MNAKFYEGLRGIPEADEPNVGPPNSTKLGAAAEHGITHRL